jgi:hypothetical protein
MVAFGIPPTPYGEKSISIVTGAGRPATGRTV